MRHTSVPNFTTSSVKTAYLAELRTRTFVWIVKSWTKRTGCDTEIADLNDENRAIKAKKRRLQTDDNEKKSKRRA